MKIYDNLVKKRKLLITALLIVLFFVFGYNKILVSEFYGIHEWRMSDGLAFAYRYYQGGDFFEPRLFCLLSDNLETGKMVGEFPLIYWLAGKLWYWFTYSELLYRLLSFSLTIIGFSSLYKVLKDLFKSTLIGLGVTLICFSSPIILYYGVSFVTNMHAFSFALLGWYFFYFGYFKHQKFYLGLSVWAFALAGLLKVTAAASLFLLLPLIIWRIYKTRKIAFVNIALPLGFFIYWYAVFLPNYTALHQGKYTINGLWPLWELTQQNIDDAVKFFKEITFWSLQSPILSLLFPIFIVAAFYIKGKQGAFFIYMTIGYIVGFTVYLIFWFGAVNSHDYYFTNFLIMLFFLLVTGIYFIMNRFPKSFHSMKFKIPFIFFVLFSISYGANNLRMRYSDQLTYWKGFAKVFSHDIEPGYWEWMAQNSKAKQLRGIDKYLDSLGILETDRIIYISDPSFSIEPYSAKREGYTQQFMCWNQDQLKAATEHRGDYILISNPQDTTFAKDYIGEKLGEFRTTLIYKTKR